MLWLVLAPTLAMMIGCLSWHGYEDQQYIRDNWSDRSVGESAVNFYERAKIRSEVVVDEMKFRVNSKMDTGTVKTGKHQYEVIYYIGRNRYTMKISPNRKPSNISRVISNAIDVTENILQFFGPKKDWHGLIVTPKILGYSDLSFEMIDGTVFTFREDDEIKLEKKRPSQLGELKDTL